MVKVVSEASKEVYKAIKSSSNANIVLRFMKFRNKPPLPPNNETDYLVQTARKNLSCNWMKKDS